MNRTTVEIIIAGKGGQGIILLGNMIGELLMRKFEHVAMKVNYGPETRGSSSSAEVTASKSAPPFPGVVSADYALCWTEDSLSAVSSKMKSDGIIVADSHCVSHNEVVSKIVTLPSIDIARAKTGKENSANIVMLGFFGRLSSLYEQQDAETVVKKFLGERQENEQLIKLGWELGSSNATPQSTAEQSIC